MTATHPDIHLLLHAARAAGLPSRAPHPTTPGRLASRVHRGPLRTRLGWTLVEFGLRLVATPLPPARTTRPA
ncbi:hypothetical protein [Streptomyces sp. NPDC015131]|uniref:hypothetical protein n=1 Tax=Streptomyces sp. NPDC015131 TaxID=3364941 RepID=UPI0036FD8E91